MATNCALQLMCCLAVPISQCGRGESRGVPAPAAQVVGRAFNAATGCRVTLNQTFSMLQKLTGYNGPPEYGSERADDIKHSRADISRIEMAIGYKPTVMLEEGLRQTVEWSRTQAAAATR